MGRAALQRDFRVRKTRCDCSALDSFHRLGSRGNRSLLEWPPDSSSASRHRRVIKIALGELPPGFAHALAVDCSIHIGWQVKNRIVAVCGDDLARVTTQ